MIQELRYANRLPPALADAPAPPLAVDVKKAAALLDCSERTIWNLMENGKLKWCKVGGARRVNFQSLLGLVNGK